MIGAVTWDSIIYCNDHRAESRPRLFCGYLSSACACSSLDALHALSPPLNTKRYPSAKNALASTCCSSPGRSVPCAPIYRSLLVVQIETAYDTFLMQSMRQRISGDMQINPNIKYADVPTRQTIRQVCSAGQGWLSETLSGENMHCAQTKIPQPQGG